MVNVTVTSKKMYLSTVSSRLLLYDINSWELKKSYGCYDGILRDVSWSDDGKYLLQVNAKGLVEILSPAELDIRSLQHIPLKDTWSASFHRDGHRNIAIGTKSGNVMIWDTKNKTITKTFPTPSHQSNVNFLSYNAKNTSLAATMQNGETVIYGLVSNIPVLTVKLAYSRSISAMKFHHESRSILGLATDEGHLVLRDITTNKDKVFFENVHASPVSDFAYSLINKDVVLSCGYDKLMHVYDIRLQNVVSTTKTSYTLTSLTINSENQVALGTKNGFVLIYDLRNLSVPFKVFKGHEEEVHRVAFQPVRRKSLSTEISLREEAELNVTSPTSIQSDTKNRLSDNMFLLNDTLPRNNLDVPASGGDAKADSFLVMMGLDKSNDYDDELNKSIDIERKSDKQEKYRYSDLEKNKVSTPLNSKVTGNLAFPSPIFMSNGVGDSAHTSNGDIAYVKESKVQVSADNVDTKSLEELKDFIKLTVADVADDNRNYFLHIMMSLTKQKLYLEKHLSLMSQQVLNLTQSQSTLIEANRKLALEIEMLKSQRKCFS